MDKIEKIRKEIERRIRELDEQIVDIYDSKAVLRKDELQRLLSFLDTLKEEPDNGLEEEMDRYFDTMQVFEHENIFEETFHKIARHFAKWGAKHL